MQSLAPLARQGSRVGQQFATNAKATSTSLHKTSVSTAAPTVISASKDQTNARRAPIIWFWRKGNARAAMAFSLMKQAKLANHAVKHVLLVKTLKHVKRVQMAQS